MRSSSAFRATRLTVRAVSRLSVQQLVGPTWSGRSSTTRKPDEAPASDRAHL